MPFDVFSILFFLENLKRNICRIICADGCFVFFEKQIKRLYCEPTVTKTHIKDALAKGPGWVWTEQGVTVCCSGVLFQFAQHEGYQPASLRLIKEALKMDPPHQNLQTSSRSHSEGTPGPRPGPQRETQYGAVIL